MFAAGISSDLVVSTLAVAAFYLFIYLILLLWHKQLELKQVVGVETLVFFLAFDMAIATGRADLSCFLGSLIVQLHNKQMIFAALSVGTLLVVLASSVLQARAWTLARSLEERGVSEAAVQPSRFIPSPVGVLRLAAWAIRATVGTMHTIVLVGFAS
jgi:hypothetical protein